VPDPDSSVAPLLSALRFAADRHRDQRRKDPAASPYLNHPIAVAELLARVGGVGDPITLIAAVLHDTVEDTATTPEELERTFGAAVRRTVAEVSDDKALPKLERKRLQIEHAPHLSERAKLIKLADLTCNVGDIGRDPPSDWSLDRRRDYLDWSERVIEGCRGVNAPLERAFDGALARARERLID
jgi:guanosine-3',5'-bis(diphosphate) 3'-pyrophosphohydrolase